MNMNGNLAPAVLAGISAQEAKTPPAYLIAESEVTGRAAFQKYAERALW